MRTQRTTVGHFIFFETEPPRSAFRLLSVRLNFTLPCFRGSTSRFAACGRCPENATRSNFASRHEDHNTKIRSSVRRPGLAVRVTTASPRFRQWPRPSCPGQPSSFAVQTAMSPRLGDDKTINETNKKKKKKSSGQKSRDLLVDQLKRTVPAGVGSRDGRRAVDIPGIS